MATTGVLNIPSSTDIGQQRGDNAGFGTGGSLAYCVSSTASNVRYSAGFRFTGLGIPAGATITAVNLTVTPQNTVYDDILCHIYVQDTGSPPTIDVTNTINNRTLYGTSAAWSATSLGTSRATATGSTTDTNMLAMFQYLSDTYSGITGVFIKLEGDNSATSRTYRVNSWTAGSTYWPQLEVTYTTDPAITKSENITVSENVSVSIAGGGVSDLGITVSDNITVSESPKVELNSSITTSDSVTITENKVLLLNSSISTSDTITTTESTKVELNSFVNKSDNVTVSENSSVFYPTAVMVFDASSGAVSNGFSAGTTLSWSHTTSGTNRLLVISAMAWQDVAGTGTVSGVTYNGAALTKANATTGGAMRAEVWYIKNPTIGTNTVVVTYTGNTDARKASGVSFTNADQTSPLDASNVASGTSSPITLNLTTTTDNATIVDAATNFTTTALTIGAGQVSVRNDVTGSTGFAASYKGPASPATSYPMSWTKAGTDDWAIVAASFKPNTSSDLSVTVSDSITTTENVSLLIPTLLTSVNDTVTTTESTQLLELSSIAVSDTVTSSESISILLVSQINKSEPIIVYDTRTNLLTNPSFESDTPGDGNTASTWTYTYNSGTITYHGPANDFAFYGSNSLKIATSSSSVVAYQQNYAGLTGGTYTFSAYVKTDASVTNAAVVIFDGGNTTEAHVGANTAGRISVTRKITGSGTFTIVLGLGQYTGGASGGTVWFDGAMLERADSSPSYIEGSTAANNVTALLNSFINKSDSVTISENTVAYIPTYNINVSDSVTITESSTVAIQQQNAINTSDNISISEAVSLLITALFVSVNDTLTATEATQLLLTSFVNTSDTVTTTENVSVNLPSGTSLTISVNDNISITESIQIAQSLVLSTSDTVTITENKQVVLESNISKSDSITITETIGRLLTSFIGASDSITITESRQLNITTLFISVSDSITSTESVTAQQAGLLLLTTNDTITITENVTLIVTNAVLANTGTDSTETITSGGTPVSAASATDSVELITTVGGGALSATGSDSIEPIIGGTSANATSDSIEGM